MENYDLGGACSQIVEFLDALTNWYIRRSRERFWRSGLDDDKQAAFDTLYTVLVALAKIAAPFLPFTTDEIYSGLTGERSVHLSDWPRVSNVEELAADTIIYVDPMDKVREICAAVRRLRERENIRIRQPLASCTVVGVALPTRDVDYYKRLIADEVNVREVRFAEGSITEWVSPRVQLNFKLLGPRLGPHMKAVQKAAREGAIERLRDGQISVGGFVIEVMEYEIKLDPKPGVVCEPLPAGNAIAMLDTTLTDELIAEGVARDVVRSIQQARKDADLYMADCVRLALLAPAEWRSALERFESWIAEQTLALEIAYYDSLDEFQRVVAESRLSRHDAQIGEHAIAIGLARSPE
jgi:isoleucyl-tRNA synthetase